MFAAVMHRFFTGNERLYVGLTAVTKAILINMVEGVRGHQKPKVEPESRVSKRTVDAMLIGV